jgi:flagella basal body P-ring formation protein FlgA
MNLRFCIAALLVALAMTSTLPCPALPMRQVEVMGSRVRLGDVLPSAVGSAATLDLGPTPQAGASRLLTKSELVAALDHEHVPTPSGLPDAVRVVRKIKRLERWDVDALVRTVMAPKPLHHGVVLAVVNAERPIEVADGYVRVDVEVPRAPKKPGAFATSAILSFVDGEDQVLSRVAVPIVLAVSEDGAAFDTPRGSNITLLVRRNLVEVRVPGVATVDGDVGDPVSVQIRSSGRVLRAQLLSKDEALALEAPR